MSAQSQSQQIAPVPVESFDTIVIGGGQAGLSVGYHLSRLGIPYVILDADARAGGSWGRHWDSMRLFTPARRDGLPGMPFPAAKHSFPTGAEMADYLRTYADRFDLPVRRGVRVDALGRASDGRFLVAAGERRFAAGSVVIATGPFQAPRIPAFARELDPRIVQLHSSEYRNPAQLPDGDVLVVGAGTSGADIALELAAERRVTLSGALPAEIPFDIEGLAGRLIFPLLWLVWSRLLTYDTPVGRKALPKIEAGHQPLIRVKSKHLAAAGVELAPRTVGVRAGAPALEDGRTIDVRTVVWSTGYRPAHDWIDLPVVDARGDIACDHDGVVASEPGLYRVGREFLHAFSSHTVGGVGRDARRVAERIAATRRDTGAARS